MANPVGNVTAVEIDAICELFRMLTVMRVGPHETRMAGTAGTDFIHLGAGNSGAMSSRRWHGRIVVSRRKAVCMGITSVDQHTRQGAVWMGPFS